MRKTFILALLALVLCGARAVAQSSLMATLSHDGQISTFYGASALQQAHEAADHGDVITLSSGSFAGINITKAITIRGAGMEVDTVHAIEPTVISTGFNIDIADSIPNIFTMEGVYNNSVIGIGHLSNAMFLKCRFNVFTLTDGAASVQKDLNFINCRIADEFVGNDKSSASFINCVINDMSINYNGYYSIVNCVLLGNPNLSNSELKNSILMLYQINTGNNGNTYFNNLFVSGMGDGTFSEIPNTTNALVRTDDARIANLLGDYSDSNPYTLTEEAKNILKGTDGTEVGIYGGNIPYDATPTNPRITKFEVSPKTTADGKLSVDIEVNGGE